MDPNELDRLEALEKAATQAPWSQHIVDVTCVVANDIDVLTTCDSALATTEYGYDNNYERMEADAAFIAALRNAAPALIAAAEERNDFADQLALRTPTAQDVDMQEIMRINNELRALLVRAGEAMEPFAKPLEHEKHLANEQAIECETRNECQQIELRVADFRRVRAALAEIRRATQGEAP